MRWGPVVGIGDLLKFCSSVLALPLQRESEMLECRFQIQWFVVGGVSCALVGHAACIVARHKECDV